MKKNKLVLVGSLFVVTLGVLITLFTVGINQEGAYKKSELSFLEKTSIDDATAWMEARLRDPETGQKMSDAKLKMIEKAIKDMPAGKALPLSWVEEGPDNIGGRTRAILVDKDNNNRIYAGSVSGGLYVSSNGANSWSRITSFPGVSFITSIAQMQNGAIFVATGIAQSADPMSNFNGNGIWYTEDDGATWTIVPGTSSITRFSEIVCADNANKLWIGTPTGLKTWDFGGASLNNITTTTGSCNALQISKDGSLIICAIGSNRTFVSADGGSTFVDKSGNTGAVVPVGAGRMEYAISATKNASNKYTLYAIRTGNNLQGMNISQDGGETWAQFYGAINPPSNVDIYRGQGLYNTVATVDPTNTKKLFVGGIDVWRWTQTVDSPPTGGIEPASLWSVNPTSPIYVHADIHEFEWDVNNRLYVGNDGGVGVSNTLGNTWYPANRGYNVTQFYGMAFDKNGSIAGGSQDNGTLYNDHTLSTYQEFREIGGGDGFHCAISFYNPSIIFSTIYNGEIFRSIDGGGNRSSFVPVYPASYGQVGLGGGAGFPFYNFIKLVEYYDTNSEDSLLYSPDQNYDAGDVVPVQSAATGNIINYVTPTPLYYDEEVFFKPSLTQTRVSVQGTNGQNVLLGNLTYTPFPSASGNNPPAIGDSLMVNFPTGPSLIVVQSVGSYPWYFAQHPISGKIIELGSDQSALSVAWDTVMVQDPYQSWFVTYVNQNGGELWGTRDALRLSVVNPVWLPLVRNIGGTGQDIIDVEFSKDMNRMYVSAGSKVTRVDGLGSIYSSDPNFNTKAGFCCAPTYLAGPTGTTTTTVSTGAVEGIALNPSNSNDLIIFQGAGVAKRSLNAGSASPTFTNLASISGASSPFTYDGIIDRDDSDIIVIGTSHGVFVSDNGGTTWTQSSDEFDGTPVYHVVQSTRTFAEGNSIPGVIYIATHGRGIWKSSSLLGLKDDTKTDAENFKTKLKAFPNPTANSAALSFELLNAGTVTVNVYSITGSKVKTIVEKNMSSGYNTLDLDASDLPKGTYIVKFNSGGQSQTTKFVKM